jgi:hypothetical protein
MEWPFLLSIRRLGEENVPWNLIVGQTIFFEVRVVEDWNGFVS